MCITRSSINSSVFKGNTPEPNKHTHIRTSRCCIQWMNEWMNKIQKFLSKPWTMHEKAYKNSPELPIVASIFIFVVTTAVVTAFFLSFFLQILLRFILTWKLFRAVLPSLFRITLSQHVSCPCEYSMCGWFWYWCCCCCFLFTFIKFSHALKRFSVRLFVDI